MRFALTTDCLIAGEDFVEGACIIDFDTSASCSFEKGDENSLQSLRLMADRSIDCISIFIDSLILLHLDGLSPLYCCCVEVVDISFSN